MLFLKTVSTENSVSLLTVSQLVTALLLNLVKMLKGLANSPAINNIKMF